MKTIPGRNGGVLKPKEKGDPPNEGAGRPPGSKNRATIARKILETQVNIPDKIYRAIVQAFPTLPKVTTLEEAITFVQAFKALTGNTLPAKFGYELLMDSGYGKPTGDTGMGLNIPSGAQIIINLTPDDGKSDPM